MQNSRDKLPGSVHMNLAVSAIMIFGGTFAFIRKGSKMSLVGGNACGLGLIGASYLITNGKEKEGHGLAGGVGSLLMAGMGQRLIATGKFMPAGLLAIIGTGTAGYNLKKYLEWSA